MHQKDVRRYNGKQTMNEKAKNSNIYWLLTHSKACQLFNNDLIWHYLDNFNCIIDKKLIKLFSLWAYIAKKLLTLSLYCRRHIEMRRYCALVFYRWFCLNISSNTIVYINKISRGKQMIINAILAVFGVNT